MGERGCGKTSLLANWIKEFAEERPDIKVFSHFIGSSAISIDVAALMRRCVQVLRKEHNLRCKQTLTSFTKEVNPLLAKRPLKTNEHLASSVKQVTGVIMTSWHGQVFRVITYHYRITYHQLIITKNRLCLYNSMCVFIIWCYTYTHVCMHTYKGFGDREIWPYNLSAIISFVVTNIRFDWPSSETACRIQTSETELGQCYTCWFTGSSRHQGISGQDINYAG